MLKWLKNLLISDSPEKTIKRLTPIVQQINELEPQFVGLSDEALRRKTEEFRQRLADGEGLDDLLPEAFAAVREAARRSIGLRHFDVQLLGGMVLHEGKIAEMRTGEGKTLVATLPAYLNALTGRGVHVVTVNDYLAKRDVQWMGPVYHRLGVSVASIQHEASFLYNPEWTEGDPRFLHLQPITRKEAYAADITYGTNNEFGFDYLRDNMVVDLSQRVQRGWYYAIVDEVDNILIDEARTPLIISGQAEEPTEKYYHFARAVQNLQPEEDYTVDEKTRSVMLTDQGITRIERILKIDNLFDPANFEIAHHVQNALKAKVLFKRDRDYVVRNGEVVIVDEFTGRLMFGRRWSDGLHQAIEAKEGVKIQRESVTLATITFQNYFRMYEKLAGMTGTALTEQEEFHKIYNLDVVPIPTHKPMIRIDYGDVIYKTEKAKFNAVVEEIIAEHKKGRPVLVGTVSIEKSEYLSSLLSKRGIPHNVLNAKYHEREALIVAQAGAPGQVTIATNMAGRGTDIILGGNVDLMTDDLLRKQGIEPHQATEEQRAAARAEATALWEKQREQVVAAGGLHIIGTERHEARRIDNQLRGRAGRQGDPGSSRFFVSLEDDIMRRFGGDRVKKIMEWAGMEEDVPIEHPLVSKSIETAQTKVEGYNFDIRKHVVQYDDVMNKQREVIYGERNKILSGADLKANIREMIHRSLENLIAQYVGDRVDEETDFEPLLNQIRMIFPLPAEITPEYLSRMSADEVIDVILEAADRAYEEKEREVGSENMRLLERLVLLRAIDTNWVQHLTQMEHIREGIGLRAYGQADPLVAYKKEAFALYDELRANIERDTVNMIYHVGILQTPPPPPAVRNIQENRPPDAESAARARAASRAVAPPARNGARAAAPVAVGAGRKVGRNEPCPCGSGRKYKKCHGAL
ncbi:MAG: preprotein translocase subunit SecA [Chloroflexota bacterium]|nr:preprotein translocase subunit SecA [Dehalococcoidia bacterium]MDW8255004.1 preprotein translocase subunit SecA [Chloroflexota bacterium]